MDLAIKTEPFSRTLYGRSVTTSDFNYAAAGMPLMEAMFGEIEQKAIAHKGIVHWVYDGQGGLFVGIELRGEPPKGSSLERKDISLSKYALYTHCGSYHKLSQVHDQIHEALQERQLTAEPPFVEIYSHWSKTEQERETDILIGISS